MLLFYSCNATVKIAGWWVTRAGACACACRCWELCPRHSLRKVSRAVWGPHGASVAFGSQEDSDP